MKMIILAAGLGTRMREVTGGRPKLFVEAGGMTLLERLVALAARADLEPVVVVRPELAADFRAAGVEVWLEEGTPDMMVTLSNTRRHVREPFAWVAGDMLICDEAPLMDLVRAFRSGDWEAAFLYARSDRFKAKFVLHPKPEVLVTRQGTYSFSLVNFGLQVPRLFSFMPGDLGIPRGNFLQRALDEGTPILFREYPGDAFEIDTPADLETARGYFNRFARES
jgi:NDP-sugar pyrophosphorylase family protein